MLVYYSNENMLQDFMMWLTLFYIYYKYILSIGYSLLTLIDDDFWDDGGKILVRNVIRIWFYE